MGNAAGGDFTLVAGTSFRPSATDGGSGGADVRAVTAAVNGITAA